MEVGLAGVVLLFFATALTYPVGTSTLWVAAVVTATTAVVVGMTPLNSVPVGWATPPGGVPTPPGGYHLGGLTGTTDFKVLTAVVLAAAVVCFFQSTSTPTGYEPLLISLIATVAGLFTTTTDDLVLLYLGLELQALSLYTLVGFYKFDEERTDSAVRYLLSGSLVSGFMLLGFARVYGLNGTFHLGELTRVDPTGAAWVAGVLFFKLGVAPFHFWSPVVYTPLEWGTLGITLGAAKVNLWYLLVYTLGGWSHLTWWVTWWAGVASVVIGSVGGYFQTRVTGLLAYSGVINGGYLLLLVTTGDTFGVAYYLWVYSATTLGLLMVLSLFGDTGVTTPAGWNKLGVAFPLVVYWVVLSLGGLPVFPGFFAKLVLLKGVAPLGWLLLWGVVAASVVPAVYYVSVASAALFGYSDREVNPPTGVTPPTVAVGVLVLTGVVTVV